MDFTTRPELQGDFGMVASTHYLASACGMAVLELGGNAFDAAVAAGFTLQVVEPHLNGPGGDMSLLFARSDGPPTVLCGQGPAPAAATPAAFDTLGLTEIPGSGLTAAAIPGSTVAWLTLLRDHGTLPLADVLSYAIHYADRGIPVLPSIARTIGTVADLFVRDWTGSAATYLSAGTAPMVGSRLRNPTLADTWRRLVAAAQGHDRESGIEAALAAWRAGFVADAIDVFARDEYLDSSGTRHRGLLTGEDLAGWSAGYEPPASVEFAGYTVFKTGLWGQGPVLLQQLAILAGCDLDIPPADLVHTVVEVTKLAFADREAWYGDAADVTVAELLDPGYTAVRRSLVSQTASLELRPGRPGGRSPRLPTWSDDAPTGVAAPGVGEPTVRSGAAESTDPSTRPDGAATGDTCHVDVVDRWGNMVSATPSGGWLQSSPVIPALGFPLGTRLQMMTLEPGLPSTLAPGRRPRTTLSPTLAARDGDTVLAFGTPGGDQQDQWQLAFFLALAVGRANLQEAIDSPMFHTTHFPSSFWPRESRRGELVVESRWGAETLAELRRRGHRVVESAPWSLGRISAVSREPATGVLRAGANPRGMQGYAAGR